MPTPKKLSEYTPSTTITGSEVVGFQNGSSNGTATIQTILESRAKASINALSYGMKLDGRRCQYVGMANGGNTVTCNQANFTSADIGKYIAVMIEYPDGTTGTGRVYQGTITAVTDSSHATVSGVATAAATGTAQTFCFIGTDDSAALQAALNAAKLTAPSNTSNDPNMQIGSGYSEVIIPAGALQGLSVIASQVTIPNSVRLNAQSMLVNMTGSTTTPFMIFQDYSGAENLMIENCYNAGIQLGTDNASQSHVMMKDVAIWHTGNAANQIAIAALGYDIRIGHIYLKNANIGLYCDSASDLHVDELFAIGCVIGCQMKNIQQAHITNLFSDSGRGNALVIDGNCANIYARVKAFAAAGTTFGLNPVVSVGQLTTGVIKNLVLDIQANNTGFAVLGIANTKEATIDLLASNTQQSAGNSNPITTGVAYGASVASTVTINANLDTGVTPYSGTKGGVYKYSQNGNAYFSSPIVINASVAFSAYNAIHTNTGTDTIALYAGTFANVGNRMMDSRLASDSQGRMVKYADGREHYGDGTNARDVDFGRKAANVVGSDGIIQASKGFFTGLTAPATSTSTGTQGTFTWDFGYLYVCVAANTWKRVNLNLTTW